MDAAVTLAVLLSHKPMELQQNEVATNFEATPFEFFFNFESNSTNQITKQLKNYQDLCTPLTHNPLIIS